MKILAVIPARGGSKGIPKKNIVKIAGKPLIAWSIEAAHGSKYIDRTILSSDSDEIISVAKSHGAEVIKRPARFAYDHVCSDIVALHVSDHLRKKEKYHADIIVLLQPTSPLRTSKDIDDAIELFLRYGSEALVSVYEVENRHLKSFFIGDNLGLKGIVNNDFPFMNRQSLPKIYMPNGAIYVIWRKILEKSKKFFSKKTIAHIMDYEKSIDIDTIEDIKKVERILKRKSKK